MTDMAVGLEVYTVRHQMSADMEGTLRQIAAMGYEGLETAGGAVSLPASVRPLLDELGLRVFGIHASVSQLENDFDGTVAYCRALGTEHVTIAYTAPEVHRDVP